MPYSIAKHFRFADNILHVYFILKIEEANSFSINKKIYLPHGFVTLNETKSLRL
jgi:hypothetical protein